MRRELWEAIVEMTNAVANTTEDLPGLSITSATLDLPTETIIAQTERGFRLLIDAPHYRWDTGLRPQLGRLRLEIEQSPSQNAVSSTSDY